MISDPASYFESRGLEKGTRYRGSGWQPRIFGNGPLECGEYPPQQNPFVDTTSTICTYRSVFYVAVC